MRTFLRLFTFLLTATTLFAASPFEYSPVVTNMTTISITSMNNRVMSMLGGNTVTNDGFGGFFIFLTNSTATVDNTNVFDRSIPAPVNAAFTSGAGSLATATYYYRVTALNALGETTPSTETSLAITGPAGVNVNWTMVPGATGYRVYGRSTGAELFIAEVGKVGTYLDTGSITPSGAMPGSNTTGGGSGRWLRLYERVYGPAGPDGGVLDGDFPNPGLVNTAVTPGPYGTATEVGQFTVDADGRLTAAANVTITGTAPGGAAGGALTGTYPNPGIDLGTGAFIAGNLPLSNIVQIADNSLLGNFTGGLADIQVLTSITSANLDQVVSDDTGSGALVFGTSPTFTTGITTPAATVTGLTAPRVVFTSVGGTLADDADMTFGVDTLTVTKLVAPTSVSTPSLISTAAITATPAAGSGFNVNLSTTGDFVVNTDDLVVDTSAGRVGVGTAAPGAQLDVLEGTAGTTGVIRINHSDNTNTGSHSRLFARTGGSSGGDPYLLMTVDGATDWSIGVDNSDSDKLMIGDSATVGSANVMTLTTGGNVGIGTTAPLAKLGITGGVRIGNGGGADPGANNLTVEGLTTTATLVVTTSSTHSYATASRVAVFDGSKNLVSSGVTTTTLAFVDFTSSGQTQLDARVREPKYGAGDPNFLGTTGDDDGQMFVNTDTGERWWYYAAGTVWLP